MFKSLTTGIGIGAGVLLYDLIFKGVHDLDWKRAIFVAVFAFLVIVVYHRRTGKTPG